MFARRQGGNGAASLIGVGGKSSAAVAAFCNAELWNGLDMDPVPHVPPIVIPAILAVAEERTVCRPGDSPAAFPRAA